MIPAAVGALVSLAVLLAPHQAVTRHQAPIATGIVMWYRPGIFASVGRVRGMALAWGQVDGFAAVADCARVDPARPWVVYARINGGPLERFEVLDCSQTRDLARHRREGLVLEVDHASAVRAYQRGKPRLLLDGKAPVVIMGWGRL